MYRQSVNSPAHHVSTRRRKKKRYVPVVFALFVAALIGAYGYYQWTAPYRTLNHCIRALEARDAETLAALALPEEVVEVKVSRKHVAALLPVLFEKPVRLDGIGGTPYWEHGDKRGEPRYLRQNFVYWAYAKSKRPVPGVARYTSRPQMSSTIIVKKTPAGWRVNVGYCLWSTALSKWGRATYPEPFADSLSRAGVTGYIDSTGVVYTAEEVRRRAQH